MSFEAELAALIPNLKSVARRLTGSDDAANDLVQETLTRAIEKRHQYEAGTSIKAWSFKILRNLHCDFYRAKSRRGPHQPFHDSLAPAILADQEVKIELLEVSDAFARLPERQQWLLDRIVSNTDSYLEVARELGVAEGTVKSRVCRARAHLRALQESGTHVSVSDSFSVRQLDAETTIPSGPGPAVFPDGQKHPSSVDRRRNSTSV